MDRLVSITCFLKSLSFLIGFQSLDSLSPLVAPAPRRLRIGKRNAKADILNWDPQELAEQLTLVESQKYAQIRARECITWTKSLKQEETLRPAFGALKDHLLMWVKTSILNQSSLGKRADTVERWIRVAEVTLAFSLAFTDADVRNFTRGALMSRITTQSMPLSTRC